MDANEAIRRINRPSVDIRKVTGPGSDSRAVTLPKNWSEYCDIRKGDTVYILTNGKFALVCPSNVDLEAVKKNFDEMVRLYEIGPKQESKTTRRAMKAVAKEDRTPPGAIAPEGPAGPQMPAPAAPALPAPNNG